MRKLHLATVAGLALFSFFLDAQTVFVLPGPAGSAANVTAFAENPFAQSGVFTATPSAFKVLAKPDGSMYYVISSATSNTVMVVNSLFSNPQALVGFGTAATAAVLTPDGQRVLVAAGNLQIVNTFSNSLAVSSGISVGGTAIDVAASLDSSEAFVVANTGSGSQLTSVNLTTLTSGNPTTSSLPITGAVSGVSVGPNGLVYVSTTSEVDEIDPSSLVVLNRISNLNGNPGKLSFTPDGKFGLAINQTPSTGSAIMIFDLNAKTLSSTISTSLIPASVMLSNLYVVSPNRVFAYSPNTSTLLDVTLSPAAAVPFALAPPDNVTAAAISGDIASGSHPTTRYLFYVSGNIIYEVDLTANSTTGQLMFTGSGGVISVASPANTSATPAAVLTYGDQQNVALSGNTEPLVVRVLDGNGNPVAGVGVTFQSSAAGVTIQTPSTTTSDEGFATTRATVPNTAGPLIVSYTVAGGLSGTFTVNVGASGPVTSSSSGLTITAGQGSLLQEGSTTALSNSTMAVTLTDSNGNPIVGSTVTFTIASGSGTLQCPVNSATVATCSPSQTSLSISTDGNGIAQSDFLANSVPPFPGVLQSTITASTSSSNTVTFYITAYSVAIASPSTQLLAPQIGSAITGSAGQILPGAIQVEIVSGLGQPIPNVSLRIVSPPNPANLPSASCVGTFAMTNVNGLASCDLTLSGKEGLAILTAEAGYRFDFGPFSVQVGAGAPASITIVQGNNQSGKPGSVLPQALLVTVTDSFGNLLIGTPVTWKVLTQGAVTLSNVSSATDTQGRASALVTIGTFSGTAQVQVTAGSASATFSITSSIPVAGVQIVSGNNQFVGTSAQFANPLVVMVTDTQGNPVQNVQVTFTVKSGSATLTKATPTTDPTGSASTTVTAGATPGPVVITATVGGVTATFNLTVSPPGPSNVVFLNGASFQAVVAPGAIVSIQGQSLTPGIVGVVTPNTIIGPLPYTLAGAAVSFNGIPAPIFSVSNLAGIQQITVQVPYEVAGSTSATVNITTPGNGSGTATVTLQTYAPGVFSTNAFGLQNETVALRPDGSYVSPTNPARRGENIVIFVTGAGQTVPVSGTNLAGVPGQNLVNQMAVGLYNAGVPLVSAQTVVGLVGVDAITMSVPTNIPAGAQVPVGFIVYDAGGNPYFANGTVIPVQ